MPRFVLIHVAASLTGLTQNAIRQKISKGVWMQGKQYRKGPDGRIYIDMKGYEEWVQT